MFCAAILRMQLFKTTLKKIGNDVLRLVKGRLLSRIGKILSCGTLSTNSKNAHYISKAFIYGCMDAFSLDLFARDLLQRLRTERNKVFVCAVAAVLGIVLGIVAYNVTQCSWWGANRCNYAYKLLYGGFFTLLLSYVLCACAISLVLCCSSWRNIQWLCVVTMFVVSIYFGANCCAVCVYSGFLGVLYVLLVLLPEEFINWLSCFFAFSEPCCGGSFRMGLQNVKLSIFVQIFGIFVKILIIFALLRTLTALI